MTVDLDKPASSLATLRRQLVAHGVPFPLYREPSGYYYWGDDALEVGASVYVTSHRHLTIRQWIKLGLEAVEGVEQLKREREERAAEDAAARVARGLPADSDVIVITRPKFD